MNRNSLILGIFLGIVLMGNLVTTGRPPASRPATRTSTTKAVTPWEVVRTGQFTMAVPKGWRRLPMRYGAVVLYLNGDGISVPLMDETGGPIQIGMTVERFGKVRDSAAQGAKRRLATAAANPRLKVLSLGKVETLKLSDGTDAAFIRTVFLKDGTRKSLQMKAYAADRDSRGWVVSAWVVTGKDSKFIDKNKPLEKWLRTHMTSFCFHSKKFDTKAIAAAYRPAGTRPTTTKSPATSATRTGPGKGQGLIQR